MPDHYLTRMLLSQGVPPAALGVPGRDGSPSRPTARAIWRTLRRALAPVPRHPVAAVAGARRSPRSSACTPRSSAATADESTTSDRGRLAEPEFRPRALFERFGIEVLATTESPLDDLAAHAKLAADGWGGRRRVITTFRPDDVVDMEFGRLGRPTWPARRA